MAAPFPPPVGAGEAETRAALAWLRASGDWPAVALTPATAELEWDEGENACVAPAGPSGRLLFAVYRDGDESTYRRNLNAAWTRMKNRFRVLHDVGEDRVEISPVVKFLIDEDRVRALTQVYAQIAGEAGAGPAAEPEPDEPIEGGDDA